MEEKRTRPRIEKHLSRKCSSEKTSTGILNILYYTIQCLTPSALAKRVQKSEYLLSDNLFKLSRRYK